MERKVCTGCQVERLVSNMEKKQRGKVFRWICNQCLNKISASHFGKRVKNELREIGRSYDADNQREAD